jgi:hypothetical protein
MAATVDGSGETESCDVLKEDMRMTSARTDPIPTARPELARAGPARGKPAVPARWTLLAAAAGFGGAAAVGASFGVLPSPPLITAPLAALTNYAAAHHHVMLAAAWLEGIGTLLQVIFVLAVAHLVGARVGLAGRITTVTCATVLGVSVLYDVTLIAMALSAAIGGVQTATAVVAYGLFAAVEHVFLIAPPLLLPLGLVLLRTPALPRLFAWLVVILGTLSPILGLAGLFTVTANNNGPMGAAINALLSAQGLWIAAASITLLTGATRHQRFRKSRTSQVPQPAR